MFCDLNNTGWMKKQGRQRGKACLTSNIFQSYQTEGDVVGLPSKGVKMNPHTTDLLVYNSFSHLRSNFKLKWLQVRGK